MTPSSVNPPQLFVSEPVPDHDGDHIFVFQEGQCSQLDPAIGCILFGREPRPPACGDHPIGGPMCNFKRGVEGYREIPDLEY